MFEAQRTLEHKGVVVNAEKIRDFLYGKVEDNQPKITLLEVYYRKKQSRLPFLLEFYECDYFDLKIISISTSYHNLIK